MAEAGLGLRPAHQSPEPRSTALSIEDEAVIVAFRRRTLLPLDGGFYALQPSIPYLTCSGLHRCLQRHGISRLPGAEGDKPDGSKFKRYPIGYLHIGMAVSHTIHTVLTDNGKHFTEPTGDGWTP